MELMIKPFKTGDKIQWNYSELKLIVEAKVKHYETLVYTADNIIEAKKDRADLNNFMKVLNNKRIEIKKQYLDPYMTFEQQMNEIIEIVKKPQMIIDKQVKEFEEMQKVEKMQMIQNHFDSLQKPFEFSLDLMFNPKWLNKSYSFKNIQKDIQDKLQEIEQSLQSIKMIPQFAFEAEEMFKRTLNYNIAINEAAQMAEIQKKKEQAERIRKEQEEIEKGVAQIAKKEIQAEKKQWCSFAANLTLNDALALKEFFNSRGIEFKAV